MGIDADEFVYPERISSQLFCPICTLVLESPVITEYDHLFCENCLLDWLAVKERCPITNQPLQVTSIKEPGRIILNMLGELTRYCCNKDDGCKWVGENCNFNAHTKSCAFRSRESLISEIEMYKRDALQYSSQLADCRVELDECQVDLEFMENALDRYHEKVEELEGVVLAQSAKIKMYERLHRTDEIEQEESELARFARYNKHHSKNTHGSSSEK